MKHLLFTLSFFCLLSNFGMSQSTDWANIGTTWHYDYFGYGIEGFTTYEVEKDTTVNGRLCSKVRVLHEYSYFGDPGYTDQEEPFFTYEEDSVIYFTTQNQFDTLMNLNASPGDSWKLTNQSCTEDRIVEVLDTGRTTINGCENKWIEYSYQGFSTVVDTFYSYYGSVEHAFAYFDYCQENTIDKPVSTNLRCYDDGSCVYLNGTPDCESLSVESEVLESGEIRLYPNPASDIITIKLLNNVKSTETNYQIIDFSGKVVLEGGLVNSNVDISNLDHGVYFFRIEQGGEYLGGRKVVVE